MSNHRWLHTGLHRGLHTGLLAVALVSAGAAQADPAKIAPSNGSDPAVRAFGTFAGSWMSDMEAREKRNRNKPTVERASGRAYASYTGYSKDWDVEVHATGDQSSPYVGVLRYQEQLYTCADETTKACSIARTTPVTEVFPYRNGRWKY